MNYKNSSKLHTLLFVGFLLLGMALRGADNAFKDVNDSLSTLFFLSQTLVFSGLILCWIQSLRDRLLPTTPFFYMQMAGWSMLFLLFIRTVKYRLTLDTFFMRMSWYLYYLPFIMVATCFLMCCICFNKTYTSGKERYALIPALLLIVGILTNDLHFGAFRTTSDLTVWYGNNGTYEYGPIYVLVYVWIGICIVGGVFFLIRASKPISNWKSAALPFAFLLLIPVLSFLMGVMDRLGILRFYLLPENFIFCMIGVYESCIRNDLLPHNENYFTFFRQLPFPIVITDRHLAPVFSSNTPLHASTEQLRTALANAVYVNADTKLQGNSIPAGFTFWIEDEASLHRLQEHLEDVNETLSLETTLLRYETEQKEEHDRIAARNAIYEQAAAQVYETQKDIAALLTTAQPGSAGFRDLVAWVSVRNAYVKRKANLVLSSQTLESVSIREMYLAMKEVSDYLCYCGILASVECRSSAAISVENAIAAFDTFDILIQELWQSISLLLILITEHEMQMAVNGKPLVQLPQTPCRILQAQTEDQLLITIPFEKTTANFHPGQGGCV